MDHVLHRTGILKIRIDLDLTYVKTLLQHCLIP